MEGMKRMQSLIKLDQFLTKSPPWLVLGLCILSVILLGCLDAVIQPHASQDFLYIAVVIAAAWYLGRNSGIFIAFFTVAMWFGASLLDSAEKVSYFLRAWDAMSLLVIYLTIVFMTSALKTRLRQLDELARLDSLTGLYNRRAFYQVVAQEVARSKRSHSTYTIAYIDVDNFKGVNDTYGHLGGDEVLMTIADVLKSNLRETDAVARMGGDEFVLLLPDTGADHGHTAVTKLFERLNESMRLKRLPVTFSIGVVTFKDNPCPVDDMIKKADSLMYEIKNEFKNGIRFEADCSCDQ